MPPSTSDDLIWDDSFGPSADSVTGQAGSPDAPSKLTATIHTDDGYDFFSDDGRVPAWTLLVYQGSANGSFNDPPNDPSLANKKRKRPDAGNDQRPNPVFSPIPLDMYT